MPRWAGFAEATGGQTDRQSDRRTVAPHTVTMTVLTVETQRLLGNIMAGGSAACLTAAALCVFRLAACLSPLPSRQRGPSARAGRPGGRSEAATDVRKPRCSAGGNGGGSKL